MRPKITKANIQAFFSTARTKQEAYRFFGFDPDKREDLRLAVRFQNLMFKLRNKGIIRDLDHGQFVTAKGEYVGYNQRAAAEARSD